MTCKRADHMHASASVRADTKACTHTMHEQYFYLLAYNANPNLFPWLPAAMESLCLPAYMLLVACRPPDCLAARPSTYLPTYLRRKQQPLPSGSSYTLLAKLAAQYIAHCASRHCEQCCINCRF